MNHYTSVLPSGQTLLHIKNRNSSATISLFGGQILSWIPKGKDEVLFLSKNALFDNASAIRGGVPLCWPWFGNKQNEKAHGFLRNQNWNIVSLDETEEGMTKIILKPYAKIEGYQNIDVTITFEIASSLSITLTTENQSEQTFLFTEALHTYFRVSDISNVVIKGLKGFNFLDKLSNSENMEEEEFIKIEKEIDRIYSSDQSVSILDKNRSIEITQNGGNSIVLWNPWVEKNNSMKDLYHEAFKNFVCVEAGNILEPVSLNPGKTHEITQSIHIR